jgi:N-glycosidase YbiA
LKLTDPDYGFLSNFYPYAIMDETGVVWKSTEHYYQAMKTVNMEQRAVIWAAPTARDTKKLGKSVTLRVNWNNIKEEVMMTALLLKFQPGTEMGQKLLDTMPHELCEWAPWDPYWGLGKDGKGKNRLGVLLTVVRMLLDSKTYISA